MTDAGSGSAETEPPAPSSGAGSRPGAGPTASTGLPDGADLRLPGALRVVDHATIWVERPIRRLVGSARLNPLPHAGTISVFLLGLVVVTGLYITLFFEFGHEGSYASVASMEDHAIQKVVRALHRYASAALVVTTVVHAWRIFAAGRFTGRLRRWRWATGVSALVVVWLAGVTGYWLVWDVRAQAINEIVIGLLGSTGTGVGWAVDHLGVVGGRSGSGFLFLIWLAHLLLTVVVGWFVWRHLRRTKQPWLPPPHWMALMGVPLLLVSLAVPVGMLGPAEPEALVGRIPLDPFVLFLLPPLLSSWRWLTVVVALALLAVVVLVPRLISRRDPAVVTIVDEACTGCELCVADCPYQALHMVDRRTGDDPPLGRDGERAAPRNLLAVVDPARCVGCGVCLGSCAFGAIDLPGVAGTEPIEVAGRALVIACDRHIDGLAGAGGAGGAAAIAGAGEGPGGVDVPEPVVHPVRCAGALAPEALRSFTERGATSIQLIGCAPSECRYGIGNTLAAERLSGERRPHPPSRYARRVAQDWVATDRVAGAVAHPGEHPALDTSRPPGRRESLIGVAAIAVLTAIGVAFATRAPFGGPAEGTAIRLVVDHVPGRILAADPDGPPVGAIDRVEVRLTPDGDGEVRSVTATGPGERWSEIVDVGPPAFEGSAGPGARVEVTVESGDVRRTVVDRTLDAVDGRRILIDLTDRPPAPGVDDGRRIFNGREGGCAVCHSVEAGDDGVGPTLHGIASVAGTRVEGLDAEGYLRQSILLPDQYVLDGWPAGQMLPIYRDRLSADELDAVIAYLLTLEDPATEQPVDQEGNDG
jgi:ferredoxin/mono/diheme cytochrome c family protein